MNINIGKFKILVTDFIKEYSGNSYAYITDSEISSTDILEFIEFYDRHIEKGNYFEINFSEDQFIGRFGQLIFENCGDFYKLRLVFVDKSYDSLEETPSLFDAFTNSVEYLNIKRLVVKQNCIISKLQASLLDNGILTEEELDSIFKVKEKETKKENRYLVSEVDDLDSYLIKTKSTLQEIKDEF